MLSFLLLTIEAPDFLLRHRVGRSRVLGLVVVVCEEKVAEWPVSQQ